MERERGERERGLLLSNPSDEIGSITSKTIHIYTYTHIHIDIYILVATVTTTLHPRPRKRDPNIFFQYTCVYIISLCTTFAPLHYLFTCPHVLYNAHTHTNYSTPTVIRMTSCMFVIITNNCVYKLQV